MKNPGKYLNIHNKWMERGTRDFLCFRFDADPRFELFIPSTEELGRHVSDGFLAGAWGSEENKNGQLYNDFCQNIVLLMAAMHNEL